MMLVNVRLFCFFFFQAEDGIRDLVRSRGLGDVYKRQAHDSSDCLHEPLRAGPGGAHAGSTPPVAQGD